MLQHKRTLSAAAVIVLTLAAVAVAVPNPASARPGGSHDSNQGEVHKPGWSWAKIVKAIKVSITRPVEVIIPGGGDSPTTCK
jgi:hypothetical protein